VLSSHLLDEVERTCDAVAIVDRGKHYSPGTHRAVLSGADVVVQIDCSTPDAATSLLSGMNVDVHVEVQSEGVTRDNCLRALLATPSPRSIAVSLKGERRCSASRRYRSSLESLVLEVTSRLGAPE